MSKASDLPGFADVLDAHELVVGSLDEYTGGGDGNTGIAEFEGPLARDWVEGLSSRWAGDLRDAPYVAPLADIVSKVSALSGVEAPDLDRSEGESATVVTAEGFDDDG